MTPQADHELLADFARTGAEAPFAALVQRHINLVYSTAMRFTRDAHLAEEVTQAVFILFARKAGGISAKVVLTGWLYQTTRFTAAKLQREHLRRENREQEAYMQSTLNQNETDEAWKQIAPVLDGAMDALREADRNAVLLRYFEDKPLAEVGMALGVSEDAARVRVNRALEKLRSMLTKRGVALGATAIAGAVTTNAVTAAPATLAATITTVALTGTALTLTTVAMTTIQKIAVTAVLTVTVGAGLFEAKQAHEAQSEVTCLQTQQAPMQEQIQKLQNDLSNASTTIAGLKDDFARNQKDNSELLKLRGEVGVLRIQLAAANSDAFKAAMTARASSPAGNPSIAGPNQAMLDYLGNPVPPPPGLDAAYTKQGLISAIQAAAQSANIPLKSVEIDDSEFPFLVGVVTDSDADLEALKTQIKGMNDYQYAGSISGKGSMAMNITPRSAYPRDNGNGINNRLMLRQSILYSKIQNQN
jgi:RNA polymerase sigma factor (sigma-70 family)